MFPFLPKRARPTRPPWPTIAALGTIVVLFELFDYQTKHRALGAHVGEVARLASPRRAPDAYGRAGDLLLRAPSGAVLTTVATPDLPGHRPLLGAIVDVALSDGDLTDPLIWLRTTTLDPAGPLTEAGFRPPQPFLCKDGGAGVRGYGAFGVSLTQETCVTDSTTFSMVTTSSSLAAGWWIVDELNVGTLPVIFDHGVLVDGSIDTGFVAFGDKGVGAVMFAPHMHAMRSVSRFGAEIFPAPVVLRYGEDKTVTRSLRVVAGDALSAIATLPVSTRAFDVDFGPGRGGDVSIRDAADAEIARGHVLPGATRSFRLPPGLGDHVALRDDRGIVTDLGVPLPAPGQHTKIAASAPPRGTLSLDYRDAAGAPLPVHVLLKGLDGALDPRPADADGRTVRAGRSLYLLDGRSKLSMPVGHYRVTASHGTAYSLAVMDVQIDGGTTVTVGGVLRAVVDTSGWVSADFHLHSAPSPDSEVSLDERVQSLVCEGVELAVATDHNRISDFEPSVQKLGVESKIRTAPGVEITSAGQQRWGHFNAYPLPVPSGAPEDGTPTYFGQRPAEMFESARRLGAKVVQVNHARMDPGIGYFDLAHLDAKTGHAAGEFSSDFDAFEAFNGMWIETRDKVREGPRDLVALARRGKRVSALGDSDSHKLLFEEAGYPRTYVHTPAEPADTRFARVLGVLLEGRDTTVTSGPFVEITVDGKGIGSVVTPSSANVHVKVRVSAPAWVPVDNVEVWRDDAVYRTFPVPLEAKDGVRFEGELDVPLDGADHVLLAWAEAAAPLPDVLPYAHALSIGFTGLVYVDTDHDGRVVVPPAAP